VHRVLSSNRVFKVLNSNLVRRREMEHYRLALQP
jgi:hypothetical protein